MKKTIKLGKIKMKVLDDSRMMTIQIDLGRSKGAKDTETRIIYDSIEEKHKPFLDEVLLDIQDKKAIGLHITIDKMSKKKFKKIPGITNL